MKEKAWMKKCKAGISEALKANNVIRAESLILDYQSRYKERSDSTALDECKETFRKVKAVIEELERLDRQIENEIQKDRQNYAINRLREYLLCISNYGSLLDPVSKYAIKGLIEGLRSLDPDGSVSVLALRDFHVYENACSETLQKAQKKALKLLKNDANWWDQCAYEHANKYILLIRRKAKHNIRESYARLNMRIEAYVIAEDDFFRFQDNLAKKAFEKAHAELKSLFKESIQELDKILLNLSKSDVVIYADLDQTLKKHADRLDLLQKEAPKFFEQSDDVFGVQSLLKQVRQRETLHKKITNVLKRIDKAVKGKKYYDSLNDLDRMDDSLGVFSGLLKKFYKIKKSAEEGLLKETTQVMLAFIANENKWFSLPATNASKELQQKVIDLYEILSTPNCQRGIDLCGQSRKGKDILRKYEKSIGRFTKRIAENTRI